jgi:hypothetical protein
MGLFTVFASGSVLLWANLLLELIEIDKISSFSLNDLKTVFFF